jgi:hypothetical protein
MDALFDKLPCDQLRKYNLVQMILAAAVFGGGVFFFVGYFFSLYSFQEEKMAALKTKKTI